MEKEKISILDLFYYLSETYIDLGILDSNLKSFLKNNFKKVVRKDKNLQVLFTGIRVVKGKPNKVILEYYHTKKDYECFNEVDYVVERIAIYKNKNDKLMKIPIEMKNYFKDIGKLPKSISNTTKIELLEVIKILEILDKMNEMGPSMGLYIEGIETTEPTYMFDNISLRPFNINNDKTPEEGKFEICIINGEICLNYTYIDLTCKIACERTISISSKQINNLSSEEKEILDKASNEYISLNTLPSSIMYDINEHIAVNTLSLIFDNKKNI